MFYCRAGLRGSECSSGKNLFFFPLGGKTWMGTTTCVDVVTAPVLRAGKSEPVRSNCLVKMRSVDPDYSGSAKNMNATLTFQRSWPVDLCP